MIIHFAYNLFVFLYLCLIKIASFFNKKAKLWVNGRANLFQDLSIKISHKEGNNGLIWIHCASLGEFEQGRPLIEKIKKEFPQKKILLTFFSPSGYEVRKNYPVADYICYLPIDTVKNAKKFIEIVRPEVVFFIKYEFWFNYLIELKRKNIPTYLVSGIFREDQYFFKSYGSWFRKQLGCFTHFFLQSESSEKLLNKIGYRNITVCGDTRFDRVYEISQHVKKNPLIEQFSQGKKIFIAGSSWPQDEKMIAGYSQQLTDYKLIIVPHEIEESHLLSIEKLFPDKSLRYSLATEITVKSADVLIIDNIGMLSSLYQYATIAYVGGGFGKGIHNILEPATFGIPVIFGPNFQKFTEAKDLIGCGGAYAISSSSQFNDVVTHLKNTNNLRKASEKAKEYVVSSIGATDKIFSSVNWSN